MDKVSIIITCYNKGKYIKETIDSVRNQSYQNIEIILVDDYSTDPTTRTILETIKDTGVTLFCLEKNVGVCEARNFGIKKSEGKYVLLLDGDDKISKTYIAEAINIFNRDPEVGIVTCEVELFGIMKGKMNLLEPSIENMIAQNALVVSSLFKREDFDKTNGFNSNMKHGLEDWDFWLSMIENGLKIFRIPQVHFYYRIERGSRNHLDDKKIRKLRRQIYENHKDLFSRYFLDPSLSFEYALISGSREYRVGKILCRPFRSIVKLVKAR